MQIAKFKLLKFRVVKQFPHELQRGFINSMVGDCVSKTIYQ